MSKRIVLVAMGIAVVTLLGAAWPTGAAQRPLSDFLSAQGFTFHFFPPIPDYQFGWTSPDGGGAVIDFTGGVATWLASHGGPTVSTQVRGSIQERALPDGRAELTIILDANNAIAFETDPSNGFLSPPRFGYSFYELIGHPSLQPSLVDCHLEVVIKNTAPGDPLPDFNDAFLFGGALPGQELVSLRFSANGLGTLRTPSGFPEGTPARLVVTQAGILFRGLSDPGQWHGARADGFPAERIELHPRGR